MRSKLVIYIVGLVCGAISILIYIGGFTEKIVFNINGITTFLGGFGLGFISSLIASLFFYYITVYNPRKKDEKNIQVHTSKIIRGIIGQGKITFQTLLKEASIKRDFNDILLEDIKNLGQKVKLKNNAPPIVGFVLLTGNFAEYLLFYKDRTVNDIEKVFIYLLFIDSELIKRLNRVLHCTYFILCDELLKNIHLVSDPDLTAFDSDLFEYYNAIRDLETFAIEKGLI